MNKLPLVLTAILALAMVFVLAPNILAMNRGKILRNIAIWLAIFVGLAFLYQNFGAKLPGVTKNDALMQPLISHEEPKPADKPASDPGFTPTKD